MDNRANDKVRIIGETFWIYAFCFPKKYYPTIEDAMHRFNEEYKTEMWDIVKITEHQVGLFHRWVKTSYEYDEWDEYWDYMYVEHYNKNKKYTERFAPTCWCFEVDLSEKAQKELNKPFEDKNELEQLNKS